MEWQEEVLALEEVKQVYEKLYGWKPRGKPKLLSDNKLEKGYSQERLAEEMSVSRSKITKDLQLARAIKKYPDMTKAKTKREDPTEIFGKVNP